MTSPAVLAAGLRAHAQGLCCLEAAAELLIAQTWLHRDDFTSRFITIHPGIGSGQPVAMIDWPAVIAALGSSLPWSDLLTELRRASGQADRSWWAGYVHDS
jgi:elongation factor P--beta-lysine ligase